MPAAAPESPSRRARRPRRGPGRRVLLGVSVLFILIGVAVLATAAWVGLDALRAKDSLEAAAEKVRALEALASSGDFAGVDAGLASLQEHTAEARAATTGPHWWLASRAPEIGPSVAAVQTVAIVVDDLAQDALPALGEAASAVDPAALAPRDGRIDLAPLVAVAPRVIAADAAVQGAAERLAAIETADVVEEVAGPVEELRQTVADVALTTATASRAVQLIPPMLGHEGPRRYLLLAQNNAEVRSTGGLVGAVVELAVDDGAVEIVRQGTAGGQRFFDEPVLPLTPGEDAFYQSRMARYLGNVTMTPDFPRAAELAQAMWDRQMGVEVDGVLAVDPVAVQYLLGAVGPVRTSSGLELTGADAADVLLHQVYLTVLDPQVQDAIFAEAAREAFGALTAGQGDPVTAVQALAQAARERRLLVWSAHERERELLAGTVLSGELRGQAGRSPVVGVYLNDASGAKMSYYLDLEVTVEQAACLEDGRRELLATATLTSTAPPDAAGLPRYLTGGGVTVPEGTVWTNLAFYAPTGGSVTAAWVDGEPVGVGEFTIKDLDVAARTVKLAPGESESFQVRMITGTDQPDAVLVRVTPTARNPRVSVTDTTCGF